ncbi:CPBP family intramembrane glutamic endopeptidase [Paenibacillus sp. ALE3]
MAQIGLRTGPSIMFIYSFVCTIKLKGGNKLPWWTYPIFLVLIPIVASYLVRWIGDDMTSGIVINSNPQQLKSASTEDLKYSIFSAIRSGSEEVWRYSAIFSAMYFFQKQLSKLYSCSLMKYLFLMISFLIITFLFGWIHTLGYSNSYFNFDVIIVTGTTGLLFGLVMLLTRNVWSAILTHILFNLYTTFRLNERSAFEQYNDILVSTAILILLLYVCAVMLLAIKEKHRI